MTPDELGEIRKRLSASYVNRSWRTALSDIAALVEAVDEPGKVSGMDLDRFQKEVNEWQAVTFPESTKETVLTHLKREAAEISLSQDPMEAADIFLLLMAFLGKSGVLLSTVAREKFEICKKRKWGEPDSEGVREHVRE